MATLRGMVAERSEHGAARTLGASPSTLDKLLAGLPMKPETVQRIAKLLRARVASNG
jgi:hypothetical protein